MGTIANRVEIKAREKFNRRHGLLFRGLHFSRNTDIGPIGRFWMGTLETDALVRLLTSEVNTMRWRCIICGYIHEGGQPPHQCPICGAPAKMFERLHGESASKDKTA